MDNSTIWRSLNSEKISDCLKISSHARDTGQALELQIYEFVLFFLTVWTRTEDLTVLFQLREYGLSRSGDLKYLKWNSLPMLVSHRWKIFLSVQSEAFYYFYSLSFYLTGVRSLIHRQSRSTIASQNTDVDRLQISAEITNHVLGAFSGNSSWQILFIWIVFVFHIEKWLSLSIGMGIPENIVIPLLIVLIDRIPHWFSLIEGLGENKWTLCITVPLFNIFLQQ